MLIKLKSYCQDCTKWLPYIEAFDGYQYAKDVPEDDGRNICGATVNHVKTVVGEQRLAMYEKETRCPHCDTILTDPRRIRYEKCDRKNYNFKCKDFNPFWYLRLLNFLRIIKWEDAKNAKHKKNGGTDRRGNKKKG